jgi:hypothetical protein
MRMAGVVCRLSWTAFAPVRSLSIPDHLVDNIHEDVQLFVERLAPFVPFLAHYAHFLVHFLAHFLKAAFLRLTQFLYGCQYRPAEHDQLGKGFVVLVDLCGVLVDVCTLLGNLCTLLV